MESAFLAVTLSFSIYAFRSKALYLCGKWLAAGPSESIVNYCPSSDYYYYFYTCAQHVMVVYIQNGSIYTKQYKSEYKHEIIESKVTVEGQM